MTTQPNGDPTPLRRLVDLDADECWTLAASRPVGRLAWTGAHGPSIIPVNFSLNGTEVLVRTAGYTEVARECDDSPVAFEIDDIDPAGRTGWSVLMRGHGHLEYGPPSGTDQTDVWVSGPRTLRLRIEVTEVTGRRLMAPA